MLAPFSPHGEKVAAKRPDEGAVARWDVPTPLTSFATLSSQGEDRDAY